MTTSKWVREVDEASFDEQVVAASNKQPVLVDFWASWCGPCRALGPVLEKVADDFDGKFVVAKLDTEANQALATRFQISSIPACKLFVDGEVVDEFVGALPEAGVREFLARHIKSELDEALAGVASNVKAGNLDVAAGAIAELLKAAPKNPAVLLAAAQFAVVRGEIDEACALASRVEEGEKGYDEAQALLGLADLARACRDAGGMEAATDALARDPSSATHFALGACHALVGDHEQALAQMLEVVRVDRAYGEDAARKAMLVIFARCDDEDLVRDYRRQLAIVM